ncbi:MAG: hypothetical protein U1F57_10255 [bacterium]
MQLDKNNPTKQQNRPYKQTREENTPREKGNQQDFRPKTPSTDRNPEKKDLGNEEEREEEWENSRREPPRSPKEQYQDPKRKQEPESAKVR